MNRAAVHAILLALLDALALLLALWISFTFWSWENPQLEYLVQVRFAELFPPNPWMPPALVLIPAWMFANALTGLYNPAQLRNSTHIASTLSRTTAYALVLVLLLQFLSSQRAYSRLLVLLFLGLGFVLQAAFRIAFFQVQIRLPQPIAAQKVAILGVGRDALTMAQRLERYGRHAYALAGFIVPEELEREEGGMAVPEERVLGRSADFKEIVNQHDLDILVLATRHVPREEALKLTNLCAHMGLRVLQMPFTWGFASPRLSFASLGDLQLIDLQYLSYPSFAENVKRAFDLAVVLVGGTLILPFLLLVAAAIKLESPGPVLYVSQRVGKGGRRFPFYKFRSMVVDADKMKDQLRALNESDGRLFKIRNDPRITRVGRFIRKYSIDEFPQLWNVVRGDMNLVGPRPLPVEDLEGIENDPEALYWFELRSQVKPGITGLWQVMGRSNLGFSEMVALDIQYVQNWSLWLDIQILIKTIPAVIAGRGAA